MIEIKNEIDALSFFDYAIAVSSGGPDKIFAYFDIESDGEGSWNVTNARLFYNGTDVTNIFDGEAVEQMIYDAEFINNVIQAKKDQQAEDVAVARLEGQRECHVPY